MSSLDGYIGEDSNFNYTPIFSVSQGNLALGAPVVNESLTTFGNPDLITKLKKSK